MTLFERGHMPSFAGATEWLNSEPLGPGVQGGGGQVASIVTCFKVPVNSNGGW